MRLMGSIANLPASLPASIREVNPAHYARRSDLGVAMSKHAKKRHAWLDYARNEFSLAEERLAFVASEVAKAIGHPEPKTKVDRWNVLHIFWNQDPKHRARCTVKTTRSYSRKVDVNSDAFLLSFEWRQLRMIVLKKYGARCQCCGQTPKDGIKIHVDHIKPRRRYPELALTESNLQVLCEVCNHGKGAWDETDWRPDSQSSVRDGHPSNRDGDGDGHQSGATFPRLIKRTQESRGDELDDSTTAKESA